MTRVQSVDDRRSRALARVGATPARAFQQLRALMRSWAPCAPLAMRWPLPTGIMVFAGTALVLLLRAPEKVLRAEFWADDATFYTRALADGLVLDPHGGSPLLGIRLVALLETWVDPSLAPLVGNVSALLVMAAVATFATRPCLPWSRTTGVIVAFGIALVPANFEVLGNLAHVIWPLALWTALLALTAPATTRTGRLTEMAALAFTGLTSTPAVLMLPLFARGPRYRLVTLAAVACVVAIMLVLQRSTRTTDMALLPEAILERAILVPIVGDSVVSALKPQEILLVGIPVVLLVAAVAVRSPLRMWWAWLALVMPVLGILGTNETTAAIVGDPTVAPRYFWLAGVAHVVLIANGHRAAIGLALLLILGMSLEFRLPDASTGTWQTQSACIGRPTPCEIPVAPGEPWAVKWQPRPSP